MKLKHIAIIGSLFPILFSLVLFFGVLISADSDDENSNFSSVLSSLQGYGFSLWSAGSSERSGSAEPLSCGLLCNSGVFPAILLFLHSAYVLAV